jgi:predicted alpha/beta-hydrolase family hydrolase
VSAALREIRFAASQSAGEVSALLLRPQDARVLLALAHGAGAGMRHTFMQSICEVLARNGVATFRYQFPYMENGRGRPDPQPLLLQTVRSAVLAAHTHAPDLPLFAGGKSMGGRMTSLAAAAAPLASVSGIVFIGFPLHPAKRPGTQRAEHLAATTVPLLFVQGTRDTLADLPLLQPIVEELGARTHMHVIADADHAFAVRRRTTGRTNDEVIEEIAEITASWCGERLA